MDLNGPSDRPRSTNEIRSAFLDFFEARGHRRVPSTSLVSEDDDPTLPFVTCGMVQFKDALCGQARLPFSRAVTAQRCARIDGRRSDLHHTGHTAWHNTCFEMLGNFSFGDYFKPEAIAFAWEFLTGTLRLPPRRLWVTVLEGRDPEAERLWRGLGVQPDRIAALGADDNFWALGDAGPCGPCSEIHYDRGVETGCGSPDCAIGRCDCDRWVEIWNLVFVQSERTADGAERPLAHPSIDTGMGLERVAALQQGVGSSFETDLFSPLTRRIERLTGQACRPGPAGLPFRVLADHARAATLMMGDGVRPGGEGRGYVLRRVVRRAVRFAHVLGRRSSTLSELVPTVTDTLGDAYPHLRACSRATAAALRAEEERFLETLPAGLRYLDQAASRASDGVLAAGPAAQLRDAFGFPLDVVEDVAAERGLRVDPESTHASPRRE